MRRLVCFMTEENSMASVLAGQVLLEFWKSGDADHG
jgi:hypothetical protein